jgi:aspartyl-tRNA(Asn)/glutamyl-tRNA(Gln) amidotransferase subunit C
MTIDNELVQRLAQLSKLEFDTNEQNRMKADLQKILDLVEKLNEVDVEGLEPLKYMNQEEAQLRLDEVKGMLTKAEALVNAPQKDSDYFKVPKVIKK